MATSGFDDRNIQGMFYGAYEEQFAGSYADQLGIRLGSDSAQETYGFLGANGAMREWLGARQAQTLNKKQYTVINKTYEASLVVPETDLDRDKTGLLAARMGQFANDAGSGHWEQLLVDLVNANGLCYDGQNFFDTDHSWGDSGTQVNEMGATECPSSNVGTTTAPTPLEFANTTLEAVANFLTWKNDKGRLINGNARKFLIQVSTVPLFAAATQAISAGYLTSIVDNPLTGLKMGGFQFSVQMEPRITSATAKFNIYRTDAPLKPFLLQTEKEIETQVLGPGSDYWFDNKAYKLGIDCRRAVGYGLWELAARVTFT